jgi:hypothetical protein
VGLAMAGEISIKLLSRQKLENKEREEAKVRVG